MTSTSISVVIPVKNDAQSLRRCLQELAGQLNPLDELVIVDNGGTDDSADVASAFGARIVRVSGGGIPAASAAGYDAATRPLIARLDADCIPADDWLSAIRREFERRPALTAITGPASFVDGPRLARAPLAVVYLGAYFLSLAPALGRVPLFGSNCAFTRAAWIAVSDEVHRFDPGVHDDLDLSFHLHPRLQVRWTRTMRMGISMRPLFDRRSFAQRLRRGAHTVRIHWPHDLPWIRWARRFLLRRDVPVAPGTSTRIDRVERGA